MKCSRESCECQKWNGDPKETVDCAKTHAPKVRDWRKLAAAIGGVIGAIVGITYLLPLAGCKVIALGESNLQVNSQVASEPCWSYDGHYYSEVITFPHYDPPVLSRHEAVFGGEQN